MTCMMDYFGSSVFTRPRSNFLVYDVTVEMANGNVQMPSLITEVEAIRRDGKQITVWFGEFTDQDRYFPSSFSNSSLFLPYNILFLCYSGYFLCASSPLRDRNTTLETGRLVFKCL